MDVQNKYMFPCITTNNPNVDTQFYKAKRL